MGNGDGESGLQFAYFTFAGVDQRNDLFLIVLLHVRGHRNGRADLSDRLAVEVRLWIRGLEIGRKATGLVLSIWVLIIGWAIAVPRLGRRMTLSLTHALR